MTILALDYGQKRIGIAISDESKKFATSLKYLSNNSEIEKLEKKKYPNLSPQEFKQLKYKAQKKSKAELQKTFGLLKHILNTYYPTEIIIGLPLSFDEKTNTYVEGLQAKKVRLFVKSLCKYLEQNKIQCDVNFIEESMTSKFAEEKLEELNLTSGKLKEKIDSESARIMLEEYLLKNYSKHH